MQTKNAFLFSAQDLARGKMYLWTFTFGEVLDIKKTRTRWNHLLTLLRAHYPLLCGLRVFEMHELHGLHVHLLSNKYLRVEDVRRLARAAGWGRIHVVRCRPGAYRYVAKYLGKTREACFRGWRLWAAFGNWNNTRVKDVEKFSPRKLIWSGLSALLGWEGNRGWRSRCEMVERVYRLTIANDWQWGECGGQPYDAVPLSHFYGA